MELSVKTYEMLEILQRYRSDPRDGIFCKIFIHELLLVENSKLRAEKGVGMGGVEYKKECNKSSCISISQDCLTLNLNLRVYLALANNLSFMTRKGNSISICTRRTNVNTSNKTNIKCVRIVYVL